MFQISQRDLLNTKSVLGTCIYFAEIVSEEQLRYFVLSMEVEWNIPCYVDVLTGTKS
jgi:hypothetical protein